MCKTCAIFFDKNVDFREDAECLFEITEDIGFIGKIHFDGYIRNNLGKPFLRIEMGNNAGGDTVTSNIPIGYCPVCGQKLTKE